MSHLIIESAILQEAKIIKNMGNKARFRMIMQTMDEANQNRRIYPKNVLMEGMKCCEDRIKGRSFMGEMDHPFPTGNHDIDAVRQSTVSLKEVSHLINEYGTDGNKLIGELETIDGGDGSNGRKLLGFLKEHVGVGLSMRGMAELEKNRENYNVVKSPLMIITFDTVSMPSHKAAVVNFNEMRFESINVLQESSCGTTICTPDGKCYLANYFDKLVESKIIQFANKWV